MSQQKTYRVRAEMHVQGHVMIEAANKKDAVDRVQKMLESQEKHKALDTIEIDRGSDENVETRSRQELGVYFFVPISWCEVEK